MSTGPSRISRLFRFGLATALLIVTAICVYLGYRTARLRSKYYTPVPTAAYAPDIPPEQLAESDFFSEFDFVDPLDMRHGYQRVKTYTAAIRRRIDELEGRGDEQAARALETQLQSILHHDLGLPYPGYEGKERLHAIGLYEGDKHENGNAEVQITDISGPITLVLTSNEVVHWRISLGEGVEVKRVFVGRDQACTVEGLPDSVPIEYRPQRASNWITGSRWMEKRTGLRLVTWQEAYRYEGHPFEIGPGSYVWSDQMRADILGSLYKEATREARNALARRLMQHSFPVIHRESVDRHGRGQAAFATASIFGPYLETIQPLKGVVERLVYLPHGPSFFANDGRQIVTIDPETGTLTRFEGADSEEFPHDGLIALDTENNRLYAWGRSLASMELLTRQVTVHRTDNPDVRGLTYSTTHQSLFAVCAPYDGNSHSLISQLKRFNLRGGEISTVDLSLPVPAGRHRERVGLVEVADKLVMMPEVIRDGNGAVEEDVRENYIIEPTTGEVQMVVKRLPR